MENIITTNSNSLEDNLKSSEKYPEFLFNEQGEVFQKLGGQLCKITPYWSGDYLCITHNSRAVKLHKVVADVYLPEVYGKNYVTHLDGDRSNNCVSNLRRTSMEDITEQILRRDAYRADIIECMEDSLTFLGKKAASLYYGIPEAAITSSIKCKDMCLGKHFVVAENADRYDALYMSTKRFVELSKHCDLEEIKEFFTKGIDFSR